MTIAEGKQLREFLNKGKSKSNAWTLELTWNEFVQLRALVSSALNERENELFNEYVMWRAGVLAKWQRELDLEAKVPPTSPPPKVVKGGKSA